MRSPRNVGFLSILCALFATPLLGCTGVEETISPVTPPPHVDFADCEDNPALDCGTLEVPVDHDDPDGPKMKVPVVRVRAADPAKRIGSLLLNPGGPGGSGVSLAKAAGVFFPQDLKDRFDLIGFDPRGEAGSTPSIDCVDSLDALVGLDMTPDDAAERKALTDVTKAFVEGCQSRSGDLLAHIGTDSIVRDMDMLREALGDDKLTYLGYSYGTFLGAVYADTFPDHVRALVLDGPLDPSLTNEQFIEGQAYGFEVELEQMFAWCETSDDCPLGKDTEPVTPPSEVFDALKASIEKTPLPSWLYTGRTVGPGEFAYAVSGALYQPGRWDSLAEALSEAAKGDGTVLLDLADGYSGRAPDGTYDNSFEVYYAVTSLDSPSSHKPEALAELLTKVTKKAPRIGAYLPYTALPAEFWPLPSWREAVPVVAKGAPPILVVGATRDPATPYDWAQSLAKQLPGAALLTRDGDGHTSFMHGSECIDKAVTDYLVSGALPDTGTVCTD
ncbi:MAG: alpha/beta hydrolase [Polyangiaceae bacterium]